ncbi:protein PIN-LIKES 3-like [Silene latifolia]|uniref:protein PIN-LIKES 3-like n=1 Tax=Silene latifolia TaxID=37657 RepID=UPI003D77DB95
MEILNLLYVASIPVIKVLLITALGLFLALDKVNILGQDPRKYLNQIVYYVFSPALVGSNLAKTVTLKSFLTLWFMPVNILLTFVIGSALGWVLVKLTKAPKHLHGLIIGACSAGNLGNLPIIIVPALCTESGSPFGAADECKSYGLAYASLSMALGAVFIWSYVYNIVRISSRGTVELAAENRSGTKDSSIEEIQANYTEPLLPTDHPIMTSVTQITLLSRIKQWITNFSKKINLKALLAPSTIGAIVGFIIGMISPIRNLLIGSYAPLHVVTDSAFMIGDAAIPGVTLILGANLLQGLKGTNIQLRNVFGIVAVRYLILPLIGILVVKGAVRFSLVQADPLFQFVLLLQYALPPAMSLGTITQLFGAGQTECSVIMLWTYALASVTLTLWCTFFLWLVAQ